MAEAKQPSFDELMTQIEAFEKTVSELSENVSRLKAKLLVNKEKYGPDVANWPKEVK